jgi:hypothetical protein
MLENGTLTRAHLKTPKAAAIAGIVFSLLMGIIFWMLRRDVPADPLEPGAWLAANTRTVALALNLVVCAENSNPDVLMVKAAEDRPRFNDTDGLNLSMYRSILFSARWVRKQL